MSPAELGFLLVGGVVGGGLNSVVGGGSFVAFPALVFAGIAPVSANATTALVLWPASVASTIAYRRELAASRALVVPLAIASLVGGGAGAWLLLGTSNTMFVRLIPWLLLFASTLFTFGGALATRLRGEGAPARAPTLVVGVVLQTLISIYGGYFGGGMGIMMLATFSLLGMSDIHAMNGLRTILGVVINGIAVVAFIAAGAIAWKAALIMVAGAAAAGYLGAALARRVNPRKVRWMVLVVAWGMTAWFFARAFALV